MKTEKAALEDAVLTAPRARQEQSKDVRHIIQKNYLPDELILDILSYIPPGSRDSQSTLWAFCLVAKQWYDCAIKRLYAQPHLYGKNYDLFVRTICPSVNLHVRKSDLAGHVRILDLRAIVHQSSKSMTARLLGRTKNSLEAFVAPQASFAVNCLAALSKCQQLHTLDLSLISEAISIAELAKALQRLPRLKVLYFPRSSNDSRNVSGSISWPPLEELHLSGPLERAFIDQLAGDGPGQGSLPSTLTNLTIEHCTRLPLLSIQKLLIGVGTQLERLRVSSIPGLVQHNIDFVLKYCPHLKCLEVSLDYITSRFGELERWELSTHPLERLDLLRVSDDQFSSRLDFEPRELLPEHLVEALDNDCFPNLRIIRVSKAAHWHTDKIEEVQELQEVLEYNHMTNHGTESMSKRIEMDSLYELCKDQGFVVFLGLDKLLSRLHQFVDLQNDTSSHRTTRYDDFELFHFEAGEVSAFSRYHSEYHSDWKIDGPSIFALPFSGILVDAWVCSHCVWKSMIVSVKDLGVDLPSDHRPCPFAPSIWTIQPPATKSTPIAYGQPMNIDAAKADFDDPVIAFLAKQMDPGDETDSGDEETDSGDEEMDSGDEEMDSGDEEMDSGDEETDLDGSQTDSNELMGSSHEKSLGADMDDFEF